MQKANYAFKQKSEKMLIPDKVTTENIGSIVKELREKFKIQYGKDAFEKAYIEDFNEKSLMQAGTFNRSAHPFLIAYFMAFALLVNQRLREKLKETFKEEAAKPWKGMDKNHELNPEAILKDAHESIERLLWKDMPEVA